VLRRHALGRPRGFSGTPLGRQVWRKKRAAVERPPLRYVWLRAPQMAARELRRTVKELMALDDRILCDIGLRRSEVELAARFGRSFERYKDRLRQ
jgi:uncharacterized protein YjiS (DUF1127 family)